MERIKNKIKDNFVKMLVAAVMIGLAVTGCVYLDEVSITQIIDGRECDYAIAGTEATFTVNGHVECAADVSNTNFVVAILVPKTWNVAKYAKVTYRCDLSLRPRRRSRTDYEHVAHAVECPAQEWQRPDMGRMS